MEQLAFKRMGRRSVGLKFRGTELGAVELAAIRRMAAEAGVGVGEVADAVCRQFGWLRPNGEPATSACTVFLRRLERLGQLRLAQPPRPQRSKGRRHEGEEHADILRALGTVPGFVELQPEGALSVRPIDEEERVGFRLHMQRYHYLGYERSVGESLCYAALVGNELVALLEWGAAILHNGPRDEWLGWDWETKKRRLLWVVNNRRYLILPWIRIAHLASRVLGANLRRLSRDWEGRYGHPVLLAETFVDSKRFRGTCYRASNWAYVGQTRGFSRTREGFSPNGRPKSVFLYPLCHDAAWQLRQPAAGGRT